MKYIFNAILFIVVVVISAACSSKKEKPIEALPEKPAVKNDLPEMTLALADGSQKKVKSIDEKLVLVLFQADCEHCQHEATEISQNIEAFDKYSVYFVSSNAMGDILKFAETYKLSNKPNFTFAYTTTDQILNNFGPIAAPSVYIYDNEGKLRKQFNGQVPIDSLLNNL